MKNLANIILSIFTSTASIIGSYQFLLIATSFAFCLKTCILIFLIFRGTKLTKISRPLIFILLVLIGTMASDVAWILKLSKSLFFPSLDYRILTFLIRIAWALFVVQYQSLALFIEGLTTKKGYISFHQKIFLIISFTFVLFFVALAFYNFNCFQASDRFITELNFLNMVSLYALIPLMLSSLFTTIKKIITTRIPRILKRQIKIFIQFFICPFIISDIIQLYPFNFAATTVANTYSVIGFSTLIITYAIFHCARKIIGLRFLNFENHVQAKNKFYFINDFKNVLDQLSLVTNIHELSHITQNFFKDAFNIPARRVHLYIRRLNIENAECTKLKKLNSHAEQVESFVTLHSFPSKIDKFLRETKVIITDELEFSNFYENEESIEKIITFLNSIPTDIFIPIYEKNTLVAYIIVEQFARINNENKNANFYSNAERDQMAIFANYIGNIIRLLNNRNLDSLVTEKRELKEELHNKHQEINQYKESIRSFLNNTKQKKIGIIFYKNRRFNFGNQTAQDLIPIQLNNHEGHPITKKLKKLANEVLEYKSTQTCFISDEKGEKLVILGIPNIEQNNVILIAYYPEISDILKKKIDLLKDPTKWDYLLYLETTKSGKLINQLIPGNGETLLNFKINLLKIALGTKAILLDIAEQDLISTVEILQLISLREMLHIIDLQKAVDNFNIAIKLFGANPIFGIHTEKKSILEKLDKNGILLIKNIHFLDIETQNHLAEFIRYGFYKKFRSDQKIASDVRIVCSSNISLKSAVQEGKFSQKLFNELNQTSIFMPSLLTLPDEELENLTEGFTEQAIKTVTFKNVLCLTNAEKRKLADSRPTSFSEFKIKIQQLLISKSKKHEIYQETKFDPAYNITEPELMEAVRLGKHALKDPKIMSMLWNKFQNQNKIANILGVNRSSVNRRCKDYNLIP